MSLDIAADTIARWREKPSSMVRELFGVAPDKWQERVLDLFPKQPRIAMLACTGFRNDSFLP